MSSTPMDPLDPKANPSGVKRTQPLTDLPRLEGQDEGKAHAA